MQPKPKRTDSPEVWPLVIDDTRRGRYGAGVARYRDELAKLMEARHAFGIAKYGIGIGLQVENGRDALVDCMDEALDGCVYSRQLAMRTGLPEDWETHELFVRLAARLVWRKRMETKPLDLSKCQRCGEPITHGHICPPFEPQT